MKAHAYAKESAMATIPQNRLRIDDEGNYIVEDKDYPGYTVDVLLRRTIMVDRIRGP